MNEITVFNNDEFGEVRTVLINGEPWFVGKDITNILGYQNASKALNDHVDNEDKLNNDSLLSLGQRGGWLINESGLYSLILSSKLPKAKDFKHWVTCEVLPSIHKTGSYSVNSGVNNKVESIFEKKIMLLESIAKTLNMNETGKLIMYDKLNEEEGLSTSFIPKYNRNESKTSFSLFYLLKKNNCKIKTRRFVKKLFDLGYLEEKMCLSEQVDDDGSELYEKFKSFTEKGLKYGRNVVCEYNSRRTDPMYFEDTFMELYNKVMTDWKRVDFYE